MMTMRQVTVKTDHVADKDVSAAVEQPAEIFRDQGPEVRDHKGLTV